jgi:hypothetical protein
VQVIAAGGREGDLLLVGYGVKRITGAKAVVIAWKALRFGLRAGRRREEGILKYPFFTAIKWQIFHLRFAALVVL